MRTIALLAIRNEALYLRHCLENLISQGLDVHIIDNDSTDESLAIARSFLGAGVIGIDRHPYPGYFDSQGILNRKMRLSQDLDADWFMHCDADEIRQPPPCFSSLKEGIELADKQGCNAINFDEFVFLPTSPEEHFEGTDYPSLMRQYYYFSPSPLHRVNLWKKGQLPADIMASGGHSAEFQGRKVFHQAFILRHYIALSLDHLTSKYTKDRVYSEREVKELGWHGARAKLRHGGVTLPTPKQMKNLADNLFDTSHPYRKHLFIEST